jgi:Tetratricopeptide repeat
VSAEDRKALLARGGAALESGRLADALAAAERLLTDFPGDLEALYLAGVAHSRRGEFDVALTFLDRVLERAQDAPPVVTERRRAADALGRRVVESEVCRDALGRLAPLICALPEHPPGSEWHVVLATAVIDADALALAQRALTASGVTHSTLWCETYPVIRAGTLSRSTLAGANAPVPIDPHDRSFPHGGFLVFVGLARSPATWWSRCMPSAVVVVVDEFMPCEIIARIRELSDEGARRVALMYANADLARRVSLPGRVVGDGA